MHLGVLSTKIKTLMREEVTVPNAVVVAQTTTDYSRLADTEGVLTPTSVTIGYDAPWRQVHALLVMAAERTPGLRRAPKPHVLPDRARGFLRALHAVCQPDAPGRSSPDHGRPPGEHPGRVQRYGVQIMSPNYMLDPAAPKVVAKSNWFAAPARHD